MNSFIFKIFNLFIHSSFLSFPSFLIAFKGTDKTYRYPGFRGQNSLIGRLKVISFTVTFTLTLFLALSMTTIAAAITLTVNNSTGPVADHMSIQEAINSASEGDTILVYPGNYSENVDVNVANISIRSFSGNPKDTIVVAQNSSDHVLNVTSDSVDISGFTIKGARRSNYHYSSGIALCNVSGTNIGYNILLANYCGIYLNNSSWNFLIGNNVTENNFGIYIVNSSNSNTLANNNVIKNGLFGVCHYGSSNNILRDNNIAENELYGVSMVDSINTTFISNLIWSHSYNFYVAGDYLDTNKIDPSNLVDGKPVYYFVDASDIKLDSSSNAGVIYLINCKNITIKDQLLENNMYGIYLYNTTNSSLVSNTALNNYYGIYISSARNNILMKNNASDNRYGISLENSKNNALTDNAVHLNNMYGIFLNDSSSNSLDGNDATGNNFKGIFLKSSKNNMLTENKAILNRDYGIDLYNSSSNHLANNLMENNTYNLNVSTNPLYSDYLETNEVEPNNLVDGKSVYYFVDVSDTKLDSLSNAGTVYLINCNNILLKDLFLERNGNGIYLYNTTRIILENNVISSNERGIFLWNATRSSIFSNKISSNQYSGIFLTDSSNNTIFNNYFCNKDNIKLEGVNTGNVWNTTKATKINIVNGGFSGGNFWGTPFESGFSQKNLQDMDRDSICDSFYAINEYNIDFLPLLYVPIQVLTYNAVGDVATGLHTWNYTNCDLFSNGKANDMLTESLTVNSTENRAINYGELIYKTEIKSVNYRYQEENWERKNYSIIGFFGNTFVPLSSEANQVWKSHPEKLARLTFDSNNKYNLRTGEPLYLDDGYAIEVKQLDETGKKVWLEFTMEGEFVDDEITRSMAVTVPGMLNSMISKVKTILLS